MKKVLFLFSLLSFYQATLSVASLNTGQPLSIRHIGIQQGLCCGLVVDMTLDGQGFPWVATDAGITRITGKKFTTYKTSNTAISSDDCVGLYYDKTSNAVMMHFKDGSMSIYNCRSQRLESAHWLASKHGVSDVCGAADRGIWVAFDDGTVQHYDTQTGKSVVLAKKFIKKHGSGLRTIFDDGRGHLFIGLRMDGMFIYNLKTKTTRYFPPLSTTVGGLPGGNVRAFFVDHLQNTWVGTNGGLAILDMHTGRFTTFRNVPGNTTTLAGNNVHHITELADRTLWVASDLGGISILNLNTFTQPAITGAQFLQLTHENGGLSSNGTRRIVQDTFGNIWLGLYSTGVDFISKTPSHFNLLTDKDKPVTNVTGLAAGRDGGMWIAQDNKLLLHADGKVTKTWTLPPTQTNSAPQIIAIKEDVKGSVWIGTNDNGLFTFSPTKGVFTHIQRNTLQDFHALYADPDGKVWAGGESGIFSVKNGVINSEEKINRQFNCKSLPVVYSIVKDKEGKLWIATLGEGVYVFDKNQHLMVHLYKGHGLNSNNTIQIFKDDKEGLWIATYRGLAYIPDTRRTMAITAFDERQGLMDSHLRSIVQDEAGNIWVSVFSGIACLDTKRQRFYNYSYQSGIPIDNFVESAAIYGSDGTLYFGSSAGICYFNPKLLSEPRQVSPVEVIDCERIGSQRTGFAGSLIQPNDDGSVRLAHDDNTFKVSFSVKDMSQENDVDYSYRMEGLDDHWYDIEGGNEVTFRNLQPGHYTFTVRAKLHNQEWNEASMASLPITVCPPLWLTWWAKLFYVITVLTIMAFFLKQYQRQLLLRNSLTQSRWESLHRQELDEERMRFFTNIIHELRTPITLILGPIEDLADDNSLSDRLRKRLKGVLASAERLLGLVNELLEFRKTETQNLHLTVAKADLGVLIREVGMSFKEMADKQGTTLEINILNDIIPIYFDSEVVTTVVTNLMTNAMKYTPRGRVTLSMRKGRDNNVNITVEDTGYGIDAEALPHIFDRYYQAGGVHQASGTGIGLALVKSLAELHHARISVESQKGKGSTFTFTLSTTDNYPDALHKEDTEEKKTEKQEEVQTENLERDKPMILVVEDNSDIRQYIDDSLADDFQIIQAINGREGIDTALSQIPDIIVSDIMMPEANGIELTRTLKADIRTSHIPIILLTAKTSIDSQEEGYDSGADSYLTKPFSAKLLRSRIRNIMTGRRRLAEYINSGQTILLHPITHASQAEKLTEECLQPQLGKLDRDFLDKLNKLIDDNLSTEEIDIAFLTDKVAMSISTLYRKQKTLTGMSANAYVRKRKLHRSMELLKEGRYNVTEVAMLTGFRTLGSFRENFKREFGITPSSVLQLGHEAPKSPGE